MMDKNNTLLFLLIIGFGLMTMNYIKLKKEFKKEVELKDQYLLRTIQLEDKIEEITGCPLVKK